MLSNILHCDANKFGIYLPIHRGFCTVLFCDNEQNLVTLPHIAQRKHQFFGKNEGKFKIRKSKFPKREFLWDYCIRYLDIYPQGHYWSEIMKMFGNILISGYILNHYTHHVRYPQRTKTLDQRHNKNGFSRSSYHSHIFQKLYQKKLLLLMTSYLWMLIPIFQNFIK